ncbi:MAG TPA: superoxide dismutase [Vicinamibacteria bacterium]|nr:superoxide dismutase [Vicinamibacteria bacterium]
MPRYALPDLDYDFGALEPHISGEIMELHHGKHHKAYVEKANETLDRLAESRERGDFTRLAGLERALAFNLSGHVLHSLFWKNLVPRGGGWPQGELLDLIERDFGGFEGFQSQMTEVAATVMGSGWAALVWEPMAQRLLTCQIYDHQSNLSQGSMPLMVIDAWEHAYYLQYKNAKTEFFNAVWHLWNWDDVVSRLRAARRVELPVAEPAAR